MPLTNRRQYRLICKGILYSLMQARQREPEMIFNENFRSKPTLRAWCRRFTVAWEEVQMDKEKLQEGAQFPVVVTPTEKKEQEEADLLQFKISLISPVIYQTHTYRSDRAYLEAVAIRCYNLPDGRKRKYSVKTLERWVRDYRKKGSEGLKVKTRSDLGSSRTLTLVVMVRITVILKEFPQIKWVNHFFCVNKCAARIALPAHRIKDFAAASGRAFGILDTVFRQCW